MFLQILVMVHHETPQTIPQINGSHLFLILFQNKLYLEMSLETQSSAELLKLLSKMFSGLNNKKVRN